MYKNTALGPSAKSRVPKYEEEIFQRYKGLVRGKDKTLNQVC